MKESCPVCNTEYTQNVTKCEVCGFADELGINRKWPIAEDAERWLNTVVKPYREKWQSRTSETSTPQLSADDLLARGTIHSNNKDYDRAIANFSEAIRLDPNSADAYVLRGIVYKNKENYEQAISDLTKAIAIDPNDAGIFKVRGMAYNEKGCDLIEPGDDSKAIKNFEQAIADFSKAIEIEPKDAEAYALRGGAYLLIDRGDLAMIDFVKAIKIDVNCAMAYSYRGMQYFHDKKYDLALLDYARAVEIEPTLLDSVKDYVHNMLINRYNLGMTAYNAAGKKFFGREKLILEAFNHFTNHPGWTRGESAVLGIRLFENGVRCLRA